MHAIFHEIVLFMHLIFIKKKKKEDVLKYLKASMSIHFFYDTINMILKEHNRDLNTRCTMKDSNITEPCVTLTTKPDGVVVGNYFQTFNHVK